MDFDSPDVEKEFPGLYASESSGSRKKEDSDFSDPDHDKVSKKELLIGRKKDKKDKGYAIFEGESSPEEEESKSPSKLSKKTKAFKFSTKSKEKREKSREKDKIEKDVKEKDKELVENKEKKKDKDKKDKDKKEKFKEKDKDKKEKKKQGSISDEVLDLGDVQPIFGVSLGLAVERSRCHDSVNLPLVVRDCIDYLQAHGITSEQIYKVDAVKARLQQLKKAYNNRESTGTGDFDVPTACGLLKLYLKELPEPILTTDLSSRFEEAASLSLTAQQEQEFRSLIDQLPGCNRTLLSWLSLHLDIVIKNEQYNKMNAQNLTILLSPTLLMSHRLLLAIFCHCEYLFSDTILHRYIPPITATSPYLPETPDEIAIELKKQESLLTQIHSEMNAGFVTKKREEQLWEVQRIITQLKRKLRSFEKKQDSTQKSLDDTVDGDLELSLQKAKSYCSDDESSIKTITILSTESTTNTETKTSPQEISEDITVCDDKPKETNNAIDNNADIEDNDIINKMPDNNNIGDTEQQIKNESDPNFINLIRHQLINQELEQWKTELQERINAERAEIVRLKHAIGNEVFVEMPINIIDKNCTKQDITTNDEDYERIIAHYLKENSLLEKKKLMLSRQIVDEKKQIIDLNVELFLRKYTSE